MVQSSPPPLYAMGLFSLQVEKVMFEAAQSREEYYKLLDQKIYLIRKELEDRKRNKSRGKSVLHVPCVWLLYCMYCTCKTFVLTVSIYTVWAKYRTASTVHVCVIHNYKDLELKCPIKYNIGLTWPPMKVTMEGVYTGTFIDVSIWPKNSECVNGYIIIM